MKRILLLIIILLIFTGCPVNQRNKYINNFNYLTSNVKELRYIIKKEVVNRDDIAYLFAIYFPVKVTVEQNKIPFDIKMSIYSSLIYSSVERGIMNTFPDNTFKPDDPITRYQLAIFLNKYILTIDPFFDGNFKDVNMADVGENFFAYKPIALMAANNVMELSNGLFNPFGYITGYDAVTYFHRIREFYR